MEGEITQAESEARLAGSDLLSAEPTVSAYGPIEENPKPSFNNLRQFTKEAIRAGVHFTVPRHPHQSEEKWAEQWTILSLYTDTQAPLDDIGMPRGLTRERMRQVIKQAVAKLHAAAPAELRERYPLDQFAFGKPKTETTAYRASETRGGNLRIIFQAARAGKTAQEIKQDAQLSTWRLAHARQSGKKYGVAIPYQSIVYTEEFRRSLEEFNDPETTPEKRQTILDMIGIDYADSHSNEPDSPLVKLSDLLKEANFHIVGRGGLINIAQVLRDAGIPVGLIEKKGKKSMHRYGFIAAIDRERALTVLQEEPSLDPLRKNPVELIAGTAVEIPTTYGLQGENFQSLTKVIGKVLHGKLIRSGISYRDIIGTDCPVAIFRHGTGYYARTENAEVLSEYLLARIEAALNGDLR